MNCKKYYNKKTLMKYWIISIIIFSILILLIQFICGNNGSYLPSNLNNKIMESITPNYPPPLFNFVDYN